MDELRDILLTHAGRYPQMRPTDAVKLIYQNEFGGGHLIRDERACLEYLRREYEATEKDARMPLYEPIGNGLIRVNLAAVAPGELDALGERFIRSASEHRGSMERFSRKLAILRQLTAENTFSFTTEELETFLTEYRKAGCPMVSHSPQYRACYYPAYRVVRYTPLASIPEGGGTAIRR